MARGTKKLSARTVETLKKPGLHSDGDGLYLSISATGAKRWIFVYRAGGKRTEMGLGRFVDVTLAEARLKVAALQKIRDAGGDPLAEQRRSAEEARSAPTFGEMANAYVDDMAPGWRNPKHVEQWRTTLGNTEADASKLRIDAAAEKAHRGALTVLRALPVDRIETDHVLAVLSPIWKEKPETASRLRGRIEAVIAAATAKGHRSGANPALWRNHLDRLLPRRRKLSRGHHAAMPYTNVPAFMKRLRAEETVAARALEFAILTASRSGETIGARWSEVDLEAKIWTVPADRMKAGRGHRVPLSDRAVDILKEIAKLRRADDEAPFVFPGRKQGHPLSTMAFEMTLRRLEVTGATPHGFRSSFRDWAGEETHFPREVAEAALAHVVGDETERAYRRGDALEKRRKLMDEWAVFCVGAEPRPGHKFNRVAR